MPVRTSSVVAIGLVGLAAIGVVTIFGSSLLALTAPPGAAPSPTEKQPGPPPTVADGGPLSATHTTTGTGAPTEKPAPKDGP